MLFNYWKMSVKLPVVINNTISEYLYNNETMLRLRMIIMMFQLLFT